MMVIVAFRIQENFSHWCYLYRLYFINFGVRFPKPCQSLVIVQKSHLACKNITSAISKQYQGTIRRSKLCFITLANSSGKRNVTVWHPSVCPISILSGQHATWPAYISAQQ